MLPVWDCSGISYLGKKAVEKKLREKLEKKRVE
jgi:hypothetical protein